MTIQLSKGFITRNRCYISYKTNYYSDHIYFYVALFDELKTHLAEKGVNCSFEYAQMNKSFDSSMRKGCVTVLAYITDDIAGHPYLDNIPFIEDAIN